MGAPTPHSCGMASGCDGSVGHAFCVQGCGRLAFAPRYSDCCQACPVSHTNQCGFRQPPLCCIGCGRLANRPRHTSCCRQCPAGHTGECETRQGASRERPDDAQRPSHAGEEWVWVSAEHGLFLERGAIVGPPLPAGTLTSGDRGIMPRACGAVFICQLPRLEVRGFRNEGPTGTLDLREGLRHCFGYPGTGGADRCEGCRGHRCHACALECRHCATSFCASCIGDHDCPRDTGLSDYLFACDS